MARFKIDVDKLYIERKKKMIREATKEDLMAILDIYNDAILNTTVVYTYKSETLEDRAQATVDDLKELYLRTADKPAPSM